MKTEVLSKKVTAETPKKKSVNMRHLNTASNAIIYVVLATLGILWILPIVFLLYTSFRVTPNTGIINQLIPENLQLGFDNYVRLFTDTMFNKWLINTIIVATFSCALSTLYVLMISYALSRLRFKLRKPLMNVLLVLGMFPGFMSMIAVYFILKAMGLLNSLIALILVYSGGAGLSYYICKGFFDTIPKSLEEAAILDGANRLQILLKVTVPLSKPIIIYTILTSFINPWCDFIFVNTIINDREKYTVALGLYKMINAEKFSFNENFTVFCAGATIVGIIIVALFMSMQKYYVEGVTSGAVKG
jgi:arabinogalactan oligomer/maltooligosaccharide transport system permease protein